MKIIAPVATIAGMACALAAFTPAYGWNPNEGADPVYRPTTSGSLPGYAVPHRYYNDPYAANTAAPALYNRPATYQPTYTPPPVATTPAVTYYAPASSPATAAPAMPAPLPTAAAQPATAYNPPVNTIYYQPAGGYAASNPYPATPAGAHPPTDNAYTPAPAVAATDNSATDMAYTPSSNPMPASTNRKNHYSVGVEGFYDNYREPTATVDSKAIYGGLDAGWEHEFDNWWYTNLEGRASYGRDNYKSASGSAHDEPQWEFDGRFTSGYDMHTRNDSRFKVYSGLATRYYRDEGKDELTNLGFAGYDRRIFQLYAPVGMTYEFHANNGWVFAPNIEYDALLYGNVSTRTSNVPGYSSANFQQNAFKGYGVRGEVAFRKLSSDGRGWEFTPFVRYWNLDDSDLQIIATPGGAAYYLEPENNRLQAGAKLKYLF